MLGRIVTLKTLEGISLCLPRKGQGCQWICSHALLRFPSCHRTGQRPLVHTSRGTACWALLEDRGSPWVKSLLWCSGSLLFQESRYLSHGDETLSCVPRGTSCQFLYSVCRMIRVMLAAFFFYFVCLQLMDLFHHLLLQVLQWLQHFDEGVDIVYGDSCLRLRISPRSVGAFCLVKLLLVGRRRPRFCLWRYDTHISCRPGLGWHCFARGAVFFSFAPVCFPTLQWSRQFNVGAFFVYCVLGWATSYGNRPECFWLRELGLV